MARHSVGPGQHPPTALPRLPPLVHHCSYFPCSPDVKVGRPKHVEELAALVAKFPKVKVSQGVESAAGTNCSGWISPALTFAPCPPSPSAPLLLSTCAPAGRGRGRQLE